MRLLMGEKREKSEAEIVRLKRQRRAQRRMFLIAGAATLALGVAGSLLYLDRSGTLATAFAAAKQRFTTESVALNLTVQSVEVEGRNRADRQRLLEALQVRRGTPILAVDLDAAKMRLEAVPWIRSAVVERQLPDTLFIRLAERQPLALWQHEHKFDLIDQDGAVIPNAPVNEYASLPQVVGEGAPEATPELIEMLAMEPALAAHVNASVRIGARRWDLNLDNGVTVSLPELGAEDAWHKLALLERRDHLLERDIKLVDLRLPDRTVLQLSPETAKTLIKKPKPVRPAA
jgi:cell division protein FtsQ